MQVKIYIDSGLEKSKIAQEMIGSAEYFVKLCPVIGSMALKPLLENFKPGAINELVSTPVSNKLNWLKEFNSNEDNISSIHLIATEEKIDLGRSCAATLGNIAILSLRRNYPEKISELTIHELGHTMGLVQPNMPNYFVDSNELAGGDPSNHCFSPFCIMSVRNIDPEHQASRYADYKTNPESVFCKDCKDYLQTATPEELPWYNQVKS
jgi:hypothetical protein